MSVNFHEQNEGATLFLQIGSRLVGTDYADFLSEVARFVVHPGRLCLLLEAAGPRGCDGEAIWRDQRLALHPFNRIDQLAMVGGGRWQQGLANFCKPYVEVFVRYFEQADLELAKEWLREPQPCRQG